MSVTVSDDQMSNIHDVTIADHSSILCAGARSPDSAPESSSHDGDTDPDKYVYTC